MQSSHDPCNCSNDSITITNCRHSGGYRIHKGIQSNKIGLTVISDHNPPTGKLAKVKGVKRLTKPMKNIIGDVNDVILRPQPDAFELSL